MVYYRLGLELETHPLSPRGSVIAVDAVPAVVVECEDGGVAPYRKSK